MRTAGLRLRMGLICVLVAGWLAGIEAHQDPCHRLHSCPSDRDTDVCGDRGRCDQCLDTPFCVAGTPRLASSSPPAPAPAAPIPSPAPKLSGPMVCSTPGGNCTDLIVDAVSHAHTSILVQVYGFTSAPIAKALLEAHQRGVAVQVILDQRQGPNPDASANALATQDVPTRIDARHGRRPPDVMALLAVLDGETVITGAWPGDMVLVREPALAQAYAESWQLHAQHSQPYAGRGVR